jgi:hypothetical protein
MPRTEGVPTDGAIAIRRRALVADIAAVLHSAALSIVTVPQQAIYTENQGCRGNGGLQIIAAFDGLLPLTGHL